MLRLARRASLLVAFYLLGIAGTPDAACVWVLWQEVTNFGWFEYWRATD
jgi:hypothetical protein